MILTIDQFGYLGLKFPLSPINKWKNKKSFKLNDFDHESDVNLTYCSMVSLWVLTPGGPSSAQR